MMMSTFGLHFTFRLLITHQLGEKGGNCWLAFLEKDPKTVGSRGLEEWEDLGRRDNFPKYEADKHRDTWRSTKGSEKGPTGRTCESAGEDLGFELIVDGS